MRSSQRCARLSDMFGSWNGLGLVESGRFRVPESISRAGGVGRGGDAGLLRAGGPGERRGGAGGMLEG